MRAFALMLIAALIMLVLGLPLLLGQAVRYLIMRKPLSDLWWATAIGLDQLGGSILYGEPDWTVSSRTYWLARKGKGKVNRYAFYFEQFINFFFGKNHCENSYKTEIKGETI